MASSFRGQSLSSFRGCVIDTPCRQKSGIWGFRSEKTETVDGYQAKVSHIIISVCCDGTPSCHTHMPHPRSIPSQVFDSMGLEVVTQTRVEHLPESERNKHHSINPLQDFLGAAQDHSVPAVEATPKATPTPAKAKKVQPRLTMVEYFTAPKDKKEYDGKGR